MSNSEEIREYIKEKKHDFIVDVGFRSSDDVILLYVPQEKIIDKAKKGFTSKRQLEFIKKKIATVFSKEIEVIVTQSEAHFELEAGIYQILNRKFHEKIISLYLSFSGENRVNVRIEVEILNDKLRIDVKKHLGNVLAEANIGVNTMNWISMEPELPTLTSILREVKIHQPVDLNGLLELLHTKYASISGKWLNGKLDQLRKKGFLHRETNGCYVLTAIAIASVPAGTRHTSSDIERALALGKRKW